MSPLYFPLSALETGIPDLLHTVVSVVMVPDLHFSLSDLSECLPNFLPHSVKLQSKAKFRRHDFKNSHTKISAPFVCFF